MKTSRKLCRFLHVPLQSGDDAILRTMNRRYSVQEYQEAMELALYMIPDVCFGTDVMVGFPGEGEPGIFKHPSPYTRSAVCVFTCVQLFPTAWNGLDKNGLIPGFSKSYQRTQPDATRAFSKKTKDDSNSDFWVKNFPSCLKTR